MYHIEMLIIVETSSEHRTDWNNLLQWIPCVKQRSQCHQRDSILALRVPPLLYNQHTEYVSTTAHSARTVYILHVCMRRNDFVYYYSGKLRCRQRWVHNVRLTCTTLSGIQYSYDTY